MKFITLISRDTSPILINPVMITCIKPGQVGSYVYCMSGDSWYVQDSVDDIQKKIKKATEINTITFNNPG